MASKIKVLNEHTINQIAAGEVIENPASVVKELVENSIDAGSTEICIEIKGGGRQLIRITDNGCGMSSDDALLCLERHATSKIRDVEDIHSIGTMGFRGEAIPSIASISKFTLLTCEPEANGTGTMVIVEGGKIIQCCPVARSPGTTIEVKSLFFNVPVRKKFQKSPTYDANEILKVISSIALGHPHIKFQLINDQKTELSTINASGQSFHEALGARIRDVLGADFFEMLREVHGEQDDYILEGFIGAPTYTRPNRTGQYLFINNRAIASPLVSYAVREGYGTSLGTNRYPVFVLHLRMSGMLVDVNVHPQKREVRLRQEQSLKEMVIKAVNKAIQHTEHHYMEPICLDLPPAMEAPPSIPSFNEAPRFKMSFEPPKFTPPVETSFAPPIKPAYEPVMRPTPRPEPQPVPQLFKSGAAKPVPRVISTIKQYIVVDGSFAEGAPMDGICLVDQRAAHSRIIYEKLKNCVDHAQDIAVQLLLLPYTFEATPVDSAHLLENIEAINQLGISVRQAGSCSFLVDAIPQIFGNVDLKTLMDDIVASLREHGDPGTFKKEQQKKIAAAASRAAVSQNRRLSIEEAQNIISQLVHCQMPLQCPFGKPTLITISQDEIQKKFKSPS